MSEFKNYTFIATDEFTLTLVCEAIGNPYPKIYWTFNNDKLPLEKENILVVNWKTVNQDGNYSCNAENSEGTNQKSFSIKIIEKPKLIDSTLMNLSHDVKLKDDLILPCPIIGGTNVTWMKDGRTINFEKFPNAEQTKMNDLKLTSISSYSGGNYSCIAENEAGRTKFTHVVQPLIHPTNVNIINRNDSNDTDSDNDVQLVEDIPEVIVNSGETFELLCNANGNPKPNIYWLHNLELVSVTDKLEIIGVTTDNSGIYTCVANNSYGESEKSYQLIVTAEPTYSNGELEQFYQLNVGENLNLNCLLNGYPVPQIQWFKDG